MKGKKYHNSDLSESLVFFLFNLRLDETEGVNPSVISNTRLSLNIYMDFFFQCFCFEGGQYNSTEFFFIYSVFYPCISFHFVP